MAHGAFSFLPVGRLDRDILQGRYPLCFGAYFFTVPGTLSPPCGFDPPGFFHSWVFSRTGSFGSCLGAMSCLDSCLEISSTFFEAVVSRGLGSSPIFRSRPGWAGSGFCVGWGMIWGISNVDMACSWLFVVLGWLVMML